MAFLKFRGSSTTPGTWSSTAAANAPLSNLDIDKNFASLDAQKLDLTGGTITGTLTLSSTANISGSVKDSTFFIVDDSDTSKRVQFQLTGVTTSTTRTLSVPDQTGTIALTSDLTLQKITDGGSTTSNIVSITNTTDSTSTTSGALKVSGGAAIAKNLYVGGDLIISGSATTVNTETISLADNIITLNSNFTSGTATEDAGIEVLRGGENTTRILWNEGTDRWSFTNNGTSYFNIPTRSEYNTYASSAESTTGGAQIRLTASDTTTQNIKLASAGATTVTRVDSGTINISSTDTKLSVSSDSTNADFYVPFLANSTGAQTGGSSSGLKYNPSTGTLKATNFDSTSDVRFKTDLVKIEGALGRVRGLTGYLYTLVESGQRSTGLLSQDALKVLPEVVGTSDPEKMTIAYGNMMGLIVEAIKELDDKLIAIQNQLENK